MAEPGLDFGAASQANGLLSFPAFWEMGLGERGNFRLEQKRDWVWDDGSDNDKMYFKDWTRR